jgi:glucoamylase
VNTASNGRYRITKAYVTDPDRVTLLVRMRFQVLSGGAPQLYVCSITCRSAAAGVG